MNPDPPDTAAMIPVKSFDLAKGRLADAMAATERAELARTMAAGVIAAAGPLPTFVVCGTEEVAAWAETNGATALRDAPPGLNPAVTHGADELHRLGFRYVVVAHGDLPLARSLAPVTGFEGVTIVPDRRDDGTNVMTVPLGVGFEFRYGPGSATAHRGEADRLGLDCRILQDPDLGLDIDIPADLHELSAIRQELDP